MDYTAAQVTLSLDSLLLAVTNVETMTIGRWLSVRDRDPFIFATDSSHLPVRDADRCFT